MNNTYVGIPMAGNFTCEETVNLNELNIVHKRGNILYVKSKNKEFSLTPMDNDAELVVQNFSSFNIGENESIYDMKKIDDVIVIVLYTFKNVKRVDLPSEALHFYMDRLLKNELEDTEGISDEVKFMTDEFMNNRSIFVIEDYHGKTTKYFDMYGNNWRANCERERPGVYRVRKINRYKTNNRKDQITQIYGHIEFVTFDTAIKTKGNETTFSEVKTNEIFKAWDEFLSFERELYDEEVKQKGFLRYNSFTLEGEEIVFSVNVETLAGTALFSNSESFEYDVIIAEDTESVGNTIEDIIEYKSKSDANSIWLGRCKNDSFTSNKARFDYPSRAQTLTASGILVLSDRSLKVQHKRRKKVMRSIEEKKNQTANMLMRLSAGEGDTQSGGREEPVTDDVLFKMFGKRNFQITENYREAMDIALNTPDLALIQGPPGTGKTTLIKGIVARLNSKGNKNYKILVSSEQHEALFNVVGKLSENRLIPPFVSSKKYSIAGEAEDEKQLEQNVEAFQSSFLRLCDDILRDNKMNNNYSAYLTSAIFYIQEIKEANYSIESIKEHFDNLSEAIIQMGLLETLMPTIYAIRAYMDSLEYKVSTRVTDTTEQQRILRKINSQRLSEQAFFEDDGIYQLEELQRLLNKYSYTECLLPAEVSEAIKSQEADKKQEGFRLYQEYVIALKDRLLIKEQSVFEENDVSLPKLFEDLSEQLRNLSKGRKKNFLDIVEELKYRLLDVDNATEIIKNYTNIVGSTCAQAERSLEAAELREGKYDYVIIDEAARANPLDIMLPVLMGIKVIMVGDQMQLPHYVETQYVRRFQEEKEKYKAYDKDLLQKSLFQVIYDNVEKSYNEGKLSFKRHIRIQEQHRMHPVIGNFISEQFYGGTVKNGEKTKDNTNDYRVFNSKNVAWINVPIAKGLEESKTSYYRTCEAEQVMKAIEAIVKNNPGRSLKIGIMSFYKGQVELINELLKDRFPEEIREYIECNTVDSYQGKEFDIVVLSTTRSNSEQIASKSLGFIHYSKSRINVALSRARRLLIVIGDSNTMQRNQIFSNFIDYTKREGHYE